MTPTRWQRWAPACCTNPFLPFSHTWRRIRVGTMLISTVVCGRAGAHARLMCVLGNPGADGAQGQREPRRCASEQRRDVLPNEPREGAQQGPGAARRCAWGHTPCACACTRATTCADGTQEVNSTPNTVVLPASCSTKRALMLELHGHLAILLGAVRSSLQLHGHCH